MRFTIILAFSIFLSVGSACNNSNDTPKRIEQLATGYCECAATIAEVDQKARLMTSDAPEALQGLLEQLQVEFEKSSTCLQPLLAELGPLLPEELEQLLPVLQKKCPTQANNKELITELLCQ